MRNRIPFLFLAIGILIVALAPRLLAGSSDVLIGITMGTGIGIELLGATMMIRSSRASRCRSIWSR